MKRLLCAVAMLIVAFVVPTHADTTLVQRVDAVRHSSPSYTTAILDPKLELWVLTYPQNPDVEVGRLWPILSRPGCTVLAGGYGVYWTKSQDWFMLPWLHAELRKGKVEAILDVSYYLPFSGGPDILNLDEAFAGLKLTRKLKFGLAGAVWDEEGVDAIWGGGPAIKFQLSQHANLSGRYLFGENGNAARLQINQSF